MGADSYNQAILVAVGFGASFLTSVSCRLLPKGLRWQVESNEQVIFYE